MSSLTVRKPNFSFDEGVDFQWMPDNPTFGMFLNGLSFMFVAFERYIIKAMRDAIPLIEDPAIKEEAELFMKQEGAHSAAHQAHLQALFELYPDLRTTFQKVMAQYDDLHRKESTKYHLAYIANLETTFSPILTFVINQRDILFANADPQLSSLFLWHSVEEIEHRSSAHVIYKSVVGGPLYRYMKVNSLRKHLTRVFETIFSDFKAYVPEKILTAGMTNPPHPLSKVPKRELASLRLNLFRCVMPWHNPVHEVPPQWYEEWMEADKRGVDMARYYRGKPQLIG